MEEKKLGFVGFGEAAQAIITGLQEEGYQNIRVHSHHQPESSGYKRYKRQADTLAVRLFSDLEEFKLESEVVFALVPTSAALSAAKAVIPHLRPETAYLDFSASSPELMEEIAGLAEKYNVVFGDGAIMGSVPVFKHRVPIFLSGERGKEIADYFNNWGMKLEYAGEEAGKASAIKLCRSIYTKGTQALLMELIDTTARFGITEKVLDSIDDTYYLKGFKNEAERLIESTVKHARRKADELENVIDFITSIGGISFMSEAAKKTLESL